MKGKSYTNNDGEVIKVSKEHLDTAVEIKIELQKQSPSLRCSWARHKKMMETEGFYDSDKNESYRCMIKDYQKEIGKLPKVDSYADMVYDSKLQSIKDEIGNLAYTKRDAQNQTRTLARLRRQITDGVLLVEAVEHAFRDHDFSKLKLDYKELNDSDGKKMIVTLSDLHIGALVNLDINTYNFKVAVDRMGQFLAKVINAIKLNNIRDVLIVGLGDFIEHPYMHNLAFNSEFDLSEQIVMASDLVVKFVAEVSRFANVEYAGIAGNHDRLNSDKKINISGDHAVKGINKSVEMLSKSKEVKRVKYLQAKDYEFSYSVNGHNFKFVHGDLDNINDKKLIAKHSSDDGVQYDTIVTGHYHHFRVAELGIGKTLVTMGSAKGADTFGRDNRMMSSPSQGYIIVDRDGELNTIQRVLLK